MKKKFLAVAALVAAVLTIQASPVAAVNGNCGNAPDDKTCYDRSEHTIYIINSNGTLFGSFAVNDCSFNVQPTTVNNINWTAVDHETKMVGANLIVGAPAGGCAVNAWTGVMYTRDQGAVGSNVLFTNNNIDHDWLEWFANCCSTHQFQIVN